MRVDDGSKTVTCAKHDRRRVRLSKILPFVLALALVLWLYSVVAIGAMMERTLSENSVVHSKSGRDHPAVAILAIYSSSVKIAQVNVDAHIHDDEPSNLDEYECVGWRQTESCSPLGTREPAMDRSCSDTIKSGNSGYCEVRHKLTNETKHVMRMHCNSLMPSVSFSCDMFQSLLSYGMLSADYVHDTNFSFEANRQDLRQTNGLLGENNAMGSLGSKNASTLSFERGIVYVIYEKVLLGTYVSVRSLRALGCTLPIEMWYKASETDMNHKLIKLLVAEYGVYLREIMDERATQYYTKLYAVFYSAFDSVLLLDADNFAVNDPTYLFDSNAFEANGAIFWPDYWQPSHTEFNIHKDSFVWQVFGLEFVDSFEQESGQILINRRMHQQALNVLMYYGFSLPRVHEDLRLVWGDKDLFRFAWMKTQADFFMILGPPGSAGTKHPDDDLFCGMTIVQRDPAGEVIFLHRNTEKLTASSDRLIWTHIQQFKTTANVLDHSVRGIRGSSIQFPQFRCCYGRDTDYIELFTLTPMSAFPFKEIEASLVNYMHEGAAI